MGRLSGKVAIVTGGARGQGEAEVRRFLVEDVVNVVLFLASHEAGYCTGAEFVVDGGRTAGAVAPPARPVLRESGDVGA